MLIITQYTIMRKCKKAIEDDTGVSLSIDDVFGDKPHYGYNIWLPDENPYKPSLYDFYPAKELKKVSLETLANMFCWSLHARFIFKTAHYNKSKTMRVKILNVWHGFTTRRTNIKGFRNCKIKPYWAKDK